MPFRSGYVSIVGWPNVGKSTLLNNMLGAKLSIVSPRPQTTREAILGILNEPNVQAVFVDTPGWLEPEGAFQSLMKKSIVRSIHDDADVLVWLLEARPLSEADKAFGEKLKACGKPVVAAINKIDVTSNKEKLAAVEESIKAVLGADATIYRVSAKTKQGLFELKGGLISRLPEAPPYFPTDQMTDRWERFYVSELIREQLFSKYQDEVPHASTVQIESFSEVPGRKDVIKAHIVVETEGQKKIVIGAKGRSIKELGQAARKEIESCLGRPVFLELVVKVHKNWRKDGEFLKSFLAV